MGKSKPRKPFKIAIAGLGTVGTGVIKLLQDNGSLIAERARHPIEITAINAKNKDKDRGLDLSAYQWADSPSDLLENDIDCVVELIGGENGPAKDLIEQALSRNIPVVTANKALLAHHGHSLAQMVEENNTPLLYEAAVAGGIPVIKALREGFSANKITAIYGILNGTCNYILTEMRETGRSFDDVLKEAQDKGYAEADPAFDVDGIDTAHKLAILTALAFGIKPDFKNVETTGIRGVTAADIAFAQDLGYRIRLLGTAAQTEKGIVQTVEPCLVPDHSIMGVTDGVLNAVFAEGNFVGPAAATGYGAGGGPTASAVVADIIDLARGAYVPVFGIPADTLAEPNKGDTGALEQKFYLHLSVIDKPGVIADIAGIMKEHDISIESLLQKGRDPGQAVSIILTTHEAPRAAIAHAVQEITDLESVVAPPSLMRIEGFC